MNVPDETQSAPGFGSVCSPVVIAGQSLCGKPCMDSLIPFTGGSGKLIDEALAIVGKEKSDVFTTKRGALPSPQESPVSARMDQELHAVPASRA